MPNDQSNAKKVIQTEKAPKAVGPYSMAVSAGGFLFCSGQIALNPKSNTVEATDVAGQTRQVMENIKSVLEAGHCTLDSVVKTTIFLKSMGDFPVVNEIYGSYFKGTTPARSTIEVSRLPKDVLVEIEVTAIE